MVLVPPGAKVRRPAIRRVLLPLDGTPESAVAVADTMGLLACAGVDLIVLHVFDAATVPRFMAEALATGTPVLAFPNGAAPEIVEHGLTGYLPLVRASDPRPLPALAPGQPAARDMELTIRVRGDGWELD